MSNETLESVDLKTCSYCKVIKPITEFNKRTATKDGLQTNCRECQSMRNKTWLENNYDHSIEQQRRWAENNREYVNERTRQWREDNRDHLNEYTREYVRKYRQDPENNRKHQVRQITYRAIERGELIRPEACPQCGANDSTVEAHHLSYEYGEELNVMWLCRKCHIALHQRNKID